MRGGDRAGFRPGRLIAVLLVALVVALVPAIATAVPERIKLVVDADLGDDIDDAFALAWALSSPRLEVLAVTSAWGDTALRDRMARRLLGVMGRTDVMLGHGPATPSTTPFSQARWARGGADGPPPPDAVALTLDLIRRHPHRITLVALAPMTNIAAMIERDAATFAKLRQVVLMGGSIARGYDGPRPSAEYNVAQDPAAVRRVLASGVRVVMFPLDSTMVRLDAAARARLFARRTGMTAMLAELTGQWQQGNAWGQVDPTLFDAVPVAWLVDPALCRTRPLRIAVDAKGFTRVEAGVPNVEACLDSDGTGVLARLAVDLGRMPGR